MLNFLKPTEAMKHVTREEFCANMDAFLNEINRDDVGFVITSEGKDNLVACPEKWFTLIYDNDFGCIINSAVRYSLGRSSYMPRVTVDFVLKYIMVTDTRTITVMIRDIKQALVDEKLPYRETWVTLMYSLEDRIAKMSEKGGGKRGG